MLVTCFFIGGFLFRLQVDLFPSAGDLRFRLQLDVVVFLHVTFVFVYMFIFFFRPQVDFFFVCRLLFFFSSAG